MLTRRLFTMASGALAIGALPASGARGYSWPGGARAAVSLTYDDGYDSQLENVAPLLDRLGLKATFFLTVENIDARLKDWVALSQSGHEIGNHTMTHPCRLRDYSTARFMQEQIAPAELYFNTNFGGPKPRIYAYTCGYEGLGNGATVSRVRRYLDELRPTFLAARTVNGPPNDPGQVLRQRFFLSGFEPTYDIDDARLALRYVRQAMNNGQWAILIFHEVLNARKAEGDTSKAVHQTILEQLVREPVWCAPMRTVFDHIAGVA